MRKSRNAVLVYQYRSTLKKKRTIRFHSRYVDEQKCGIGISIEVDTKKKRTVKFHSQNENE